MRRDAKLFRRGQITPMGTVQRIKEQELAWPDTESKLSLSHIPDAKPSLHWHGLPGEGLWMEGREIGLSGGTPALADASFPITVQLFRYQPPDLDLPNQDSLYKLIFYIYLKES